MPSGLIDAALAELLRAGGGPDESVDPDALLEAAREHGCAQLLAWRAPQLLARDGLGPALASGRAAAAALSLARQIELRRVLPALSAAGARVLLVKGAHLEWAWYPEPWLRPRSDADLMIRAGDRARVRRALESLGYRGVVQPGGDVAVAQFSMSLTDRHGVEHVLDVHWRISNVRAFAERLRWEELWQHKSPIPALGPDAHGPGPVHALALACIHRVAHHGCSGRLIWLYDIGLIARELGRADWLALLALSRARGIGAVIASGLLGAARRLGTALPRAELAALSWPDATDPELRPFLQGPRGRLAIAWSDWRHLGPRDRFRFAREHLLPRPAYMRQRYHPASSAALPFLYLYRVVRGLR